MKKTIYNAPHTIITELDLKSSLFAASDKTGTLIVHPDTNDGNLTPGGQGDASGGLSKNNDLWNDDEE
jgi:hypothetical protein